MKSILPITGICALASTAASAPLRAAASQPALALLKVHPGSTGNGSAVFDWINFAILIVVLVYLLRKPVSTFFKHRSATIHEGLEEGRKALDAAREKLEAVEARMRDLEQEIGRLREAAARDTEAERQRLKSAAERDTERILHAAESTIDAAVRNAKAELAAEATRQAADAAGKLISERLDETGQSRLVNRFISGIHPDGHAARH